MFPPFVVKVLPACAVKHERVESDAVLYRQMPEDSKYYRNFQVRLHKMAAEVGANNGMAMAYNAYNEYSPPQNQAYQQQG